MNEELKWITMNPRERREAIKFFAHAGYTQSQMAEAWETTRENIRDFVRRHNLPKRPQGAQKENKNARIHGQGKNTIMRLTRKILTQAGRDLFLCERCGDRSDIELPRHHKDRDRSNNIPDNLEVLCNTCHANEHLHDRERTEKGTFA